MDESTSNKKSISSRIKSIFQLPNSVKGKMVSIANVTYFTMRWVLNAAWIAATLALIITTPVIRCIEYERLVKATDKKRENNSSGPQNMAQSLPRSLE